MKTFRAFTFLEILLVLILFSLSAAVVVVILPSSEDMTKKRVRALFNQVNFLKEEAILSGKNFGLYFDESKSCYTLMSLNSEGWRPILDNRVFSSTKFKEESIVVHLNINDEVWSNNGRLFIPENSFYGDVFLDLEKKEKMKFPQILILSNGEVTPASVVIYSKEKKIEQYGWKIVFKKNGQLILLPPGKKIEDK
ncbi:general secretion pathway protein H [Candidatus Photodesmus blepharus]|uniref:General secretion pathway protein H n=1 Tax=Candidatus Photodesmus blepharonis TaxID=1179155 RepID=A0A084CNK0_9GAMM|nr:type II secretion system protein [Candidatus Photodesmus blepharus]KEY91379.1 general secretion pathway protein H [Candidatus Photodesmus blepharus]